ncbi:MAG: LysR family transcriptional regulator [Christensenella sp.]|nr:LysR family transcriptional regulator [Christensenella sp.]
MTIRHLQIFMAVCKRGGITAAAESLSMTQPAVSIAIRELENYYQTKLFDRMNRTLYLTQAGETLRRYASLILGGLDEALETLRSGEASAHCRFGVNVSIGETVLTEILQRLQTRLPNTKPRVLVASTRLIEKKLCGNEIDFAVIDSPSGGANNAAIPLFTEKMSVVCAPALCKDASIPLSTLSTQSLLLREEGSGSRSCVEAVFRAQGLSITPAAESASSLCLLHLAKDGFGYAFLPQKVAQQPISTGSLREIKVPDADFTRRYFIVYNKKKYLTPPAQATIRILEQLWEENSANG